MHTVRRGGLRTAQGLATSSRHAALHGGERYKVIRSFFLQQTNGQAKGAQNVLTNVSRTRERAVSLLCASRVSDSDFMRVHHILHGIPIRAFHLSSARLQNDNNLNPPRDDNSSSNSKRSNNDERRPDSNLSKHVEPSHHAHLENYSRFFRRLAMSLPGTGMKRPTRDDLLNVATNFWQRFRIRFKWFTIKSFRKFNADDISAFITWFLMSQTVWILVGT